MLEIILFGIIAISAITYFALELNKAEREIAEWQQAYTDLAIEMEFKNLGVSK
jgi:hypothetical protein